jgi:hypothetical protein
MYIYIYICIYIYIIHIHTHIHHAAHTAGSSYFYCMCKAFHASDSANMKKNRACCADVYKSHTTCVSCVDNFQVMCEYVSTHLRTA